jgi:hypothetical protein
VAHRARKALFAADAFGCRSGKQVVAAGVKNDHRHKSASAQEAVGDIFFPDRSAGQASDLTRGDSWHVDGEDVVRAVDGNAMARKEEEDGIARAQALRGVVMAGEQGLSPKILSGDNAKANPFQGIRFRAIPTERASFTAFWSCSVEDRLV